MKTINLGFKYPISIEFNISWKYFVIFSNEPYENIIVSEKENKLWIANILLGMKFKTKKSMPLDVFDNYIMNMNFAKST